MHFQYQLCCVLLYFMCINVEFAFAKRGIIRVFSYENQNLGKNAPSYEVNISNCSNLPNTNDVRSFMSQGQCVRFYDENHCTGFFIEIMPNAPSSFNLRPWNFSDKANSVGPCRDRCDSQLTGNIPENPVEVIIYSSTNYTGTNRVLDVDGCTQIPIGLGDRIKSITTNGICIEIYDNAECRYEEDDFGWMTSIELFEGTPYHNNLDLWMLHHHKAISHCTYKCSNAKPGEVTLYKRKYFKGTWLKLTPTNGTCINLNTEWENKAYSASVGIATCIELYVERNCSGEVFILSISRSTLSEAGFERKARSLKICETTARVIERTATHATEPQPETTAPNLSVEPLTIIIVVSVLVCIVLCFSTCCIVLVFRRHPQKATLLQDNVYDKYIKEFIGGLGLNIETSNFSSYENGNEYSVELLAENRPYNKAYDIPRSRISFDAKSPLGMGEFGIVYKGTLTICDEDMNTDSSTIKKAPVAIKTVKPGSGNECLRSLLKEVKVMLFVGKHEHVAFMIGCCTENLQKGEILVLMEYCSNGSLESYFSKNRQFFVNIVKKGKIDMRTSRLAIGPDAGKNPGNLDGKLFDFFRLLQWCIEVACGMEFLSSVKVVHSDLAARNVLLTENLTAKISDFGLSRNLYSYSQYVKKNQEPLPWRWMAIESLKNLEFTTMSDVWSYGVLCWEVFTLGEKPYPGLTWTADFISNLEDGLRLGKPKYATTECYNLLLRCWDENPTNRPSFKDIKEEYEEIKTIGHAKHMHV